MKVTAAPISLAGNQFVIVASRMELVQNAGEADMAIESMSAQFGVPVVLMAQAEDGSPNYYGDANLVELLRGVPLEEMPWQEQSIS